MTTAEAGATTFETVVLPLPRGFRAAGVHCGLKRRRPDLALVASEVPASAAGMFTQNGARAACVSIDEEKLLRGRAQAVVVNSGNANACTGPQGFVDAGSMTEAVAAGLGIDDTLVLGCSTGVIGTPLPVDLIVGAVPALVAALDTDVMPAAEAIMTTDAFPKTASAELEFEDGRVRIVGVAKGAGMIHPNMATMIAVLTTDAALPPALAKDALRAAVEPTFNCISVDGDTSTNDSVFLLANGASGCAALTGPGDPRYDRFVRALTDVSERLARAIVFDGEGADCVIEVSIVGARSDAAARLVGEAVMTSVLVKTAVYGAELNWGRIAAAVGRSGAAFELDRLSISVGGVEIVKGGVGVPERYPLAQSLLEKNEVSITVGLGLGFGSYRGWTSDLGMNYVKLNSGYLT
jgi:glutamate N-acetyltransferase/amino-acid N-acetyltransferase